MKKKASIETTATTKKYEVKKETKTAAVSAPKKKAEVKKYSLVIEGLTKTQAETLLKLLQNGVQAKIV
jgi:hypothetical protein